MKDTLTIAGIIILTIVAIAPFCYGAFWLKKTPSYSWAYEDMVEQTVREMVKPEYLIEEHTLNAKKTMTEYITANTFHGKTTDDYHQSVYGGGKSNNIFTLEYQWKDKPHRHVGDLCEWIKELQKEIEILSNSQ